jgi:hypothetical protein
VGGISRYGQTPQRGCGAKCGPAFSRRATLDCAQEPEGRRSRFSTSSGTPPYGTYVIQDFIKDVVPNRFQHPEFDSRKQVIICFFNQLTILKAIAERVDSVLDNIEGELYAELQDSELVIARQLAKVSLRAAGALIGVVIEGHLQKVADVKGVKVAKKNPTIADLNDPLKAASVIDTPTWRKISYLADIRNLCSHKKDAEPTREQVDELIQGAEWLTKNVF